MDIDDESIPYDDNSYIGEILCTYDIYSYKVETPILSEDFIKTTNFDIYVNDRKIAFTKKYKFPKFGRINVRFALTQNINMENMFKNIKSLISVKMNSNKNVKILLMNNAFENCENLNEIYMKGFDTR